MTIILFVSYTYVIMYVALLSEVRGQSCDETYLKLSGNVVNQVYVKLLKTDTVCRRLMCAMRCCLHERCKLFQFEDGQCQLFTWGTESGINLNILDGKSDVWKVDIGKETIMFDVIREESSPSYLTHPSSLPRGLSPW